MTSERVVTDAERVVTDAERRARIGRRHALATEARCEGPEQVAAAMTVLHATDPATIHLSIAARSRARIADIDRALHEDRTLLRLMAMRQTLFVASLDTAPTVIGAAGARTAHQIRTPLIKELDRDGPLGPGRGTEWLARAADAVVDRLAGGDELSAKELADEVPQVAGSVERNPGTRWGGRFPLAPRVLALLHAQGRIVRSRNAGPSQTSRPRWTAMAAWAPALAEPPPTDEAYAALVRRWLWTFGPGTVEDIQWWLSATKTAVRRALSDIEAVEVSLEDGTPAWLRRDDLEVVPDPDSWVALLPILDPTIMGWQRRDFCVGSHRDAVFDSVGNAGTTMWADGRVVGWWGQDDAKRVALHPLESLSRSRTRAFEVRARQLTEWLGGVRAFAVNPAEVNARPRTT